MVHYEFNPRTLENDIAIILLPTKGRHFYVDPMLTMGLRKSVPTTSSSRLDAIVVGYGNTSPTDKQMSRIPYYANVTTDGNRDSCNKTASTLFCSYGNAQGVLCKGDVGSGIFTHTDAERGKIVLVGVTCDSFTKSKTKYLIIIILFHLSWVLYL